MKINLSQLHKTKQLLVQEKVDFAETDYQQVSMLRHISDCLVEADVKDYGAIVEIEIHIVAHLILVCSYTLEDVNYTINTKEVFEFSDSIEDPEIFPLDGNEIFLDEIILSIIIGNLPTRIRKKGAKMPEVAGVRVMSEDELDEERKTQLDPRLAELDKFE